MIEKYIYLNEIKPNVGWKVTNRATINKPRHLYSHRGHTNKYCTDIPSIEMYIIRSIEKHVEIKHMAGL